MTRHVAHLISLAPLALVLSTGCGAKQVLLADLPPPRTVTPKYVGMATETVVIEAEDDSWRLVFGKERTPPFQTKLAPYLPHPKTKRPNGPKVAATWSKTKPSTGTVTRWESAKEAKRACNQSEFVRLFFEHLPTAPGPMKTPAQLRGAYGEMLKQGAVRVVVRAKGLRGKLHGVLALCPVLHNAESALRRIHRIEVPEEDLEAAARGQLRLVMKPYEAVVKVKGVRYIKPNAMKGLMDEEEFYKRVMVKQAGWMLWLSNKPL